MADKAKFGLKTGSIKGTEDVLDGEGRVYHLGTKFGEVANRIITVGSLPRAETVAKYFDNGEADFRRQSSRGFLVLTGKYKGVPVTVIGTGMGLAMVDMMMRETAATTRGDIAMIRFGTCGTINPDVTPGDIAIADSSVVIYRDYDAFVKEDGRSHYVISEPFYPSKELNEILIDQIKGKFGDRTKIGVNGSADSFYGSQGRVGKAFEDHNEALIDELTSRYPGFLTLEMETGHIFHMANQYKKGKYYAAAACIVLAQRKKASFLSNEEILKTEDECVIPMLESITQLKLEDELKEEEFVIFGKKE